MTTKANQKRTNPKGRSALIKEYRRLLKIWERQLGNARDCVWDPKAKKFTLRGASRKWAELGAQITGQNVQDFVMAKMKEYVDGGDLQLKGEA